MPSNLGRATYDLQAPVHLDKLYGQIEICDNNKFVIKGFKSGFRLGFSGGVQLKPANKISL